MAPNMTTAEDWNFIKTALVALAGINPQITQILLV
jgi:hypothetical protein